MNDYSNVDDITLSRKVAECVGYRVQEITADDGDVFWEMLDPQGEPCDSRKYPSDMFTDKGFLGITPEQPWEVDCHPSFATDMNAAMALLEQLRDVPTAIQASKARCRPEKTTFYMESGLYPSKIHKMAWWVGYSDETNPSFWDRGFGVERVSLPRAICELFLEVFGNNHE